MSNVVGLDIGGTWIRAAGRDAPLDDPVTIRTPADLASVGVAAAQAVATAAPRGCEAVGVGCAGIVDHRSGVVRWMPHAAGRDLDLGRMLAEACGGPAWVDNDANAAALAEARLGAGRGHRMVLTVTVGTGIGAGLVIDGELERGRGHLGEVGHMRLASGPACACGQWGCWEALASGSAIEAAARQIDPGWDAPTLVAEAERGHGLAREALEEAGGWLAEGLANLALAFDPDVIVLGGSASSEPLVGVARHRLGEAGGPLHVTGPPPVLGAAFGTTAGMKGAMIGAMEVLA